MIHFALESPARGPGYVLIATVDVDGRMPAICSKTLKDERAIAAQARELADAAAALLEALLPEHEDVFEKLHDCIDALPVAE